MSKLTNFVYCRAWRLSKCCFCFHLQAKNKAKAESGMSLEARKAHDAEIMRLKQAKKLEEAAAKAAEVAAKAAAAKKWLVLMSETSKKKSTSQ